MSFVMWSEIGSHLTNPGFQLKSLFMIRLLKKFSFNFKMQDILSDKSIQFSISGTVYDRLVGLVVSMSDF